MKDNEEYYGILLNDIVPRFDKINKFNKKVEINFEGKAFLLETNENNEIIKTKIDNNYLLEYEGDYKIEFTNQSNETYIIDIRLELCCCCIVLLFLMFLIGFLLGLFLCRPIPIENNKPYSFVDYTNFIVLDVDVQQEEKEEYDFIQYVPEERKDDNVNPTDFKEETKEDDNTEPEKEYDFDVTFENTDSDDIKLLDSISGEAVAKNKIAPGIRGCFAIVMRTKKSSVDIKYNVEFIDVTNEKPTNMIFSIRGYDKEYSTLQELQRDLHGIIEKRSEKRIIIDWKWNYESYSEQKSIEENDKIDTNEGKNLTSYKFKIIVNGEEVIK